MVNREEIENRWDEILRRLKGHWDQLSDEDFRLDSQSVEQLVGVISDKTGETRNEIERFIEGVLGSERFASASESMRDCSEATSQMAHEAATFAKDQASRVAKQSSEYSSKVAETVRARPLESLAIAFGVGVAAGALLLFSRRK